MNRKKRCVDQAQVGEALQWSLACLLYGAGDFCCRLVQMNLYGNVQLIRKNA